jgi:hypothetical protein
MTKKDLALIVDEPIPGHFYWTVVWRMRVIDYARGPMPTHDSATSAGLAAIRLHQADDLPAAVKTALRRLSGMRTEWGIETKPANL